MKKISFSFDYGGACIWEDGGVVEHNSLPISDNLKSELSDLCYEFDSQIDWNNGSCQWTKKQYTAFFKRADKAYQKLQNELSGEYLVENCIVE